MNRPTAESQQVIIWPLIALGFLPSFECAYHWVCSLGTDVLGLVKWVLFSNKTLFIQRDLVL